eukprot:tig00000310_g23996.t1
MSLVKMFKTMATGTGVEPAPKKQEKTMAELKAEREQAAAKVATEAKRKREQQEKTFKPGDYTILVHILEVKELKGRDNGGTADPQVVVEVFEVKKKTSYKRRTLSCIFDEMLTYEFKLEDASELEMGKVTVTVNDWNRILRDTPIGMYEFDIAYVYDQPDHELYKAWVPLTDPLDAYEGVQGYLNLSITVLGPGDEQKTDHRDKDAAMADKSFKDLILSGTSADQSGNLLKLSVYRAIDLPVVEMVGVGVNPYVQVRFGGSNPVRTDVIDGFTPVWNTELQLPVMTPAMSDRVEIAVMDANRIMKDSRVATVYPPLSFKELLAAREYPLRWITLYGAPPGTMKLKKDADMMNLGRKTGNWYRGRLLVSATVQPGVVDPKAGKAKIDRERVPPEPKMRTYTLRCDAHAAADIPMGLIAYTCLLEVTIGPYSATSRPVPMKDGTARWYEPIMDIDCEFPEDLDQVPDIFINVYKNTNTPEPTSRMSFIRLKAKTVFGDGTPEAFRKAMQPVEWVKLTDDPLNESAEGTDFPGFLLFGLGFGHEEHRPVDRAILRPPKMSRYELRAHIFMGRNLPSADPEGNADPFIILRCGGQMAKTTVKKGTLYPIWYETLILHVSLPEDKTAASDLNMTILDEDVGSLPDVLGRIYVPVSKMREEYRKPEWVPLYVDELTKSERGSEGEILCSFQLIPLERHYIPPSPIIKPPMKDCTIVVHVIGLRSLEKWLGQLPEAPFVEIDLGDGHYFTTDKSFRPTRESPNYLETIQIDTRLPVTKDLTPTINVRVRDYKLSGLIKRVVATTSMPLRPFVTWEEAKLDETGAFEGVALDVQPDVVFNLLSQASERASRTPRSPARFSTLLARPAARDAFLIISKPEMIVDKDPVQPFLRFQDADADTENLPPIKLGGYGSGVGYGFSNASGRDLAPPPALLRPEDVRVQVAQGQRMPNGSVVLPNGQVRPRPTSRQLNERARERASERVMLPNGQVVGNLPNGVAAGPAGPGAGAGAIVPNGAHYYQNGGAHAGGYAQQEDIDALKARLKQEGMLSEEEEKDEATLRAIAQMEKYTRSFAPPSEADVKAAEEARARKREGLERLRLQRRKVLAMLNDEGFKFRTQEGLIKELNDIDAKSKQFLDKFEWFDATPDFMIGRIVVDNELEDYLDVVDPHWCPFDDYDLIRGQKRGVNEMARLLAIQERVQKCGKLKTKIIVYDKTTGESSDERLPLDYRFDFKSVSTARDVVCRLYVCQARNLYPMDMNGFSDPYLKIRLGEQVVLDDVDNALDRELNPTFNKGIEFKTTLPGVSQLTIEVWDKDTIGFDELIGSTVIDLENRFFSRTWTRIARGEYTFKQVYSSQDDSDDPTAKRKEGRLYPTQANQSGWINKSEHPMDARKMPVEWRTLRHQRSMAPMGKLALWLEMIPRSDPRARAALEDIKMKPKEKFELRVVVWQARNMVNKDDITDMNDLYITGTLEGYSQFHAIEKETDTHWRAKKGKASFNYRLVYDIELPIDRPRLKFAAWDRDIIGANDSIGEALVKDVDKLFTLAQKKYEKIQQMQAELKKYPDDGSDENTEIRGRIKAATPTWSDLPVCGMTRQWIKLYHSNTLKQIDPKTNERPFEGEIEFELELLPKAFAEKRQAGEGRAEPNRYPTLPPPDRVKYLWYRPDLILVDLMGPELCRKVCCIACCVFFIVIIIMVSPIIAGQIVGNVASKNI